MSSLKKQALISDLIVLAHADEKVTASEYDFILRLAQRMGVTRTEVDALFEHPLPSKPLFSELERIIHFHKLVLVMSVDGEVHPKEVAHLKEFGLKMGIRPGAIDKVISKLDEYENGIIPSADLIGIFQTYYN
jgi:uncharacterized tellurite resistance protein B-like protein